MVTLNKNDHQGLLFEVQVSDIRICRAGFQVASLRRVHRTGRLLATLTSSLRLWSGKTLSTRATG